jgi:hypothetical protein
MTLTDDFGFPDFNFQNPTQQSYNADHALPGLLDTDLYPPPSSVTSPSVPNQTPTESGLKRKSSTAPESYEDASRLAAEEDKRRRNTAASARFRVKKKQREHENKWLKNLITERGERKQNDGEDVATLWKKYSEGEKGDRIKGERKDGVGTKA